MTALERAQDELRAAEAGIKSARTHSERIAAERRQKDALAAVSKHLNAALRNQGLGTFRQPQRSDGDRDHSFRLRPTSFDEVTAVKQEFGIEGDEGPTYTVGDVPGIRKRKGKQRAEGSAAIVYNVSEPTKTAFVGVGNDTEACVTHISRRRPIEEYVAALQRGGKRSPERDALKAEAAAAARELIQAGAKKQAVAGALQCQTRTITNLLEDFPAA